MKKIGIITFSRAHNYGAFLQVFALQNILNEMGYEGLVVDYRNEVIESPFYPIYFKNKNFVQIIKEIIKIPFYYKNKKARYKKFNQVIDSKLIKTINYTDKNINKVDVDVLITGSDQVWSMDIVGELSDIYTLNFKTDKKIKKISYAASVGNIQNILENKDEYIKKINNLDKISVREDDACDVLNELLENRQVERTCDPTLLISKEKWNKQLDNNEDIKEKYILAYVVAGDEEYVKIVNDLSKKTGLKVIHFGLKNPGYDNVLKTAYMEGPFEFINYIKNAEYVVATSFHATVFSIIFNKKFFIVPHRKTGARVNNLLEKLNINGRTFSNLEEFKKIDYNFETDWEDVEKRLNVERNKSINWLKEAIEG